MKGIFTDFALSLKPLLSVYLGWLIFVLNHCVIHKVLFRGAKRFASISLAGIVLPGILGAAVSYGLYEFLLEPERRATTPFSSFLLFTFVALAITAFPVLARILTEKRLLGTTVGLMSISAAAIDDICAWVLLALVISIVNAGNNLSALYTLITVTIYAALLLVPGRILLRKVRGYRRFDDAIFTKSLPN